MSVFEGYQKGINLGGWFSQCRHTQEHYDSFIGKNDILTVKSWGADHVRLPIDYELLEDAAGNPRPEGYARLRNLLDQCESAGLHVILDLHKTAGFSFDIGENESGFFGNHELQERFCKLWERIASHFGDASGFVSFELLNEVTSSRYADEWNRIADTCIRRIRAVAPDVNILVGGYHHNSILALPDLLPPQDEHIIYNFHCYEPLIFTHQGAQWVEKMPADFRIAFPGSAADYRRALTEMGLELGDIFAAAGVETADVQMFDRLFAKASEIAASRGTALYCGEYGVIDIATDTDCVNWYSAIHSAFEKYGIGRAAWCYRRMNFGISDPVRDNCRDQILALL